VIEPIEQYLERCRRLVEVAIEENLPPSDAAPSVIHEAMRYAVLAGGKRIRPILAIAACEALGADAAPLLRSFAALELIHTYSLVHDDLPALDNDDLRRGRKTTHVVFGEAIGILTGDALLTEAFSWLARPAGDVEPDRQLRALLEVAQAVDSRGMIGGQVADLEAERALDGSAERAELAARLDFIHRNKTGQLLTASVLLGGILAGASDPDLELLSRYGRAVGLAFQIVDDLLDTEESAETLGKTAGKDVAQGKLTFPALYGLAEARREADRLLAEAVALADMIGGSGNYLAEIARYICHRRS
jgi:geranylgeranyl diphosphate synthase type II